MPSQALTLPLDTAKVRLQLQAKSSGPPLYKCAALLMNSSIAIEASEMYRKTLTLHVWSA